MLNNSWWFAYLAAGIAILVALNQVIQESEKLANRLGRFGRAIHARAGKRYRMDTQEFNTAVQNATARERERWDADEARALKVVEGQLHYIRGIAETQQVQLNELLFQTRCLTAYSEYEADWHHRLRMLAVQAERNGGAISIESLPDHLHYAEFEAKCKAMGNMNWRSWKA